MALKVASQLRSEITGEENDLENLTMDDFDNLVTFWSR